MRTGFLTTWILLAFQLCVRSQTTDSLTVIALDAVTVTAPRLDRITQLPTLPSKVIGQQFMNQYFTGNFVQTIQHLPGVRSMDVGNGFAKPVVRGMGFNRVVLVNHGVKQEGQQWGADHGIEIDAFDVDHVVLTKGPASLLYGSDALGGVINILQPKQPAENQLFGEITLMGKSGNDALAGSLMVSVKYKKWYGKVRASIQHFGDYRIPSDTVVYLTQKMPVTGQRLQNTAGKEQNITLFLERRAGDYSANYSVSNVFQKTGFFPGAHGVPDITRLQDDGNHHNVALPFSTVNHLQATAHQQYQFQHIEAYLDAGYQHNTRNEYSLFHTHYNNQTPPINDPDKELEFSLQTFSLAGKIHTRINDLLEYIYGADAQVQQNQIGGYSFLLPAYDRFTTGAFALVNYRHNPKITWSGGVRFDFGKINVQGSQDPYLAQYLNDKGVSPDVIETYRWRSYPTVRKFNDVSGSLGVVWQLTDNQTLKTNIGRCFRLPTANELAANGVHHGAFRHEQGEPTLDSEHGWQLDLEYDYHKHGLTASVSPYLAHYQNYIYLQPSGNWSELPHAGQVYKYTGAKTFVAGAEASLTVDLTSVLHYQLEADYVFMWNMDEHTPLSFSPPARVKNQVAWGKEGKGKVFVEWEWIAAQEKVAKNEETTQGATIGHAGAMVQLRHGTVQITVNNVLNTKYYNHLSFYRKINVPEMGRNIQVLLKLPINILLK